MGSSRTSFCDNAAFASKLPIEKDICVNEWCGGQEVSGQDLQVHIYKKKTSKGFLDGV